MTKIFTDTAANLSAAVIKKYDIGIIPISYSVNGIEHEDLRTKEFNGKAFYNAMRRGSVIKTAATGLDNFLEPFIKVLCEGHDIIFIGLSGGISSTSHTAVIAANELRDEFPERKITAIDSLAASLGEGLQVLSAASMNESGISYDDIVECIESDKKTMAQFFTVDDLKYLKKGGRISGATATLGTLLNVKPILRGDDEGHIVSCGKARGKKAALGVLAEKYSELCADKTGEIGIAHADAEDDARLLLTELKKQGLKGRCIIECYEPVTGSHVGPGTVALFFRGIHK